jgi:hypothetical protein
VGSFGARDRKGVIRRSELLPWDLGPTQDAGALPGQGGTRNGRAAPVLSSAHVQPSTIVEEDRRRCNRSLSNSWCVLLVRHLLSGLYVSCRFDKEYAPRGRRVSDSDGKALHSLTYTVLEPNSATAAFPTWTVRLSMCSRYHLLNTQPQWPCPGAGLSFGGENQCDTAGCPRQCKIERYKGSEGVLGAWSNVQSLRPPLHVTVEPRGLVRRPLPSREALRPG